VVSDVHGLVVDVADASFDVAEIQRVFVLFKPFFGGVDLGLVQALIFVCWCRAWKSSDLVNVLRLELLAFLLLDTLWGASCAWSLVWLIDLLPVFVVRVNLFVLSAFHLLESFVTVCLLVGISYGRRSLKWFLLLSFRLLALL